MWQKTSTKLVRADLYSHKHQETHAAITTISSDRLTLCFFLVEIAKIPRQNVPQRLPTPLFGFSGPTGEICQPFCTHLFWGRFCPVGLWPLPATGSRSRWRTMGERNSHPQVREQLISMVSSVRGLRTFPVRAETLPSSPADQEKNSGRVPCPPVRFRNQVHQDFQRRYHSSWFLERAGLSRGQTCSFTLDCTRSQLFHPPLLLIAESGQDQDPSVVWRAVCLESNNHLLQDCYDGCSDDIHSLSP
jgi:hypothetical protein